jgi:hypothetical protein
LYFFLLQPSSIPSSPLWNSSLATCSQSSTVPQLEASTSWTWQIGPAAVLESCQCHQISYPLAPTYNRAPKDIKHRSVCEVLPEVSGTECSSVKQFTSKFIIKKCFIMVWDSPSSAQSEVVPYLFLWRSCLIQATFPSILFMDTYLEIS